MLLHKLSPAFSLNSLEISNRIYMYVLYDCQSIKKLIQIRSKYVLNKDEETGGTDVLFSSVLRTMTFTSGS